MRFALKSYERVMFMDKEFILTLISVAIQIYEVIYNHIKDKKK